MIYALYLTLLSQGLLWSMGHCAGMCGPLMVAFRFGVSADGVVRAGPAVTRLLVYQAARAVVYALGGAAVGYAGSTVGTALASPWITLCLAAWCVLMAVVEMGWLRLPPTTLPTALMRRASRWAGHGTVFAAAGLGAAMAFLPCAVALWALGLAAASGSPWHGAALMALLVLVTTPVLMGCVLLPALLGRWRLAAGRRLVPLGLVIAGALLAVVAIRALMAGAPVCLVPVHGG